MFSKSISLKPKEKLKENNYKKYKQHEIALFPSHWILKSSAKLYGSYSSLLIRIVVLKDESPNQKQSALPENLSEMQIPRPHPKPTYQSQALGAGLSLSIWTTPSGDSEVVSVLEPLLYDKYLPT